MQPRVTVVALSGFAVDGIVHTRGAVVELTEEDARDLLRRGKCRVATIEDAPKPQPMPEKPAETKNETDEAPKKSFERTRRRNRTEG